MADAEGVTAGRGPSVWTEECRRSTQNPTRISVANVQICRHRRKVKPGSLHATAATRGKRDSSQNPRNDGGMDRIPLAPDAPGELILDRFATPIGEMYAVADEHSRLRAFAWVEGEARGIRQLRQQYGSRVNLHEGKSPTTLRQWIDDYFEGDLHALDRIECVTNGTPFQQEVWKALRTIPVGQTLSYGALALRIGKGDAVHAVGLANGANPIAVVLPCHRVIGRDGSLTGYGGGTERKRWLLAHEGVRGLLGDAPASLF